MDENSANMHKKVNTAQPAVMGNSFPEDQTPGLDMWPPPPSAASTSQQEEITKARLNGLQVRTCAFSHNGGIPLKCDVYSGPDFPQHLPVFLYFHAGGLVGWNRKHVPPWLIQACFQRKWPLVSADYRLLPQVGGAELEADAKDAWAFAAHENTPFGKNRKVIVGGSSAGFYLAAALSRRMTLGSPKLPLLSICGIPSFQHPFFNSSTMIGSEPLADERLIHHEQGPVTAWVSELGDPDMFDIAMLDSDGSKNVHYIKAARDPPYPIGEKQEGHEAQPGLRRGALYEYYVYRNRFPELLKPTDTGFDTRSDEGKSRGRIFWPPTIVIHGNADKHFPLEGSLWMRDAVEEGKVQVFVAEGKEHLFELGSFIEDEDDGMEVVREALRALDEVVKEAI